MRALIFDEQLRVVPDAPEPRPGPEDVLLRVTLAGICATDLALTKGYGQFKGIPGHEFVGTVVEGPAALRGKRVVAEINCVCGRCDMCTGGLANHCRRRTVVGIVGRDGAFAERMVVPARNCHEVPPGITDEEAVFVEPLAAAYQITRQFPLEARMRIAVLGTGRLGLLVAQVLAARGCRPTAIGRNEMTLGRLDRKGIQTQHVRDIRQFHEYDLVVECTGSPEGLPLATRLVRPRGTIILKSTCAQSYNVDLAPLVVNELTLLGSRCGSFGDAITGLTRREVDVASLVTRAFPLSQGVAAFAAAAAPESIKILLKPGE